MTTIQALKMLKDRLRFPASDTGAQQYIIGECLNTAVTDFQKPTDRLGDVMFEYDFHCDMEKVDRLIQKYKEPSHLESHPDYAEMGIFAGYGEAETDLEVQL